MIKISRLTWLAITALMFHMTFANASEKYTLDPLHSYVLWHINHFGFSNPSGKWQAQGTLEWDNANVENSKVEVTIQLADMVTGIDELNKHLKGKQFFDVEHFPTATFVSNKVEKKSANAMTIQGLLNLHGVSKPIILEAKLNKMGKNPITDKETIGFSATSQLKRSDFGMKTLLPDLSDNIEINIEVEAAKL